MGVMDMVRLDLAEAMMRARHPDPGVPGRAWMEIGPTPARAGRTTTRTVMMVAAGLTAAVVLAAATATPREPMSGSVFLPGIEERTAPEASTTPAPVAPRTIPGDPARPARSGCRPIGAVRQRTSARAGVVASVANPCLWGNLA